MSQKNLAVVVAVAKYENANDLLACKRDAEAVHALLRYDGRFDDILYIEGEVDSFEFKDKLNRFIEGYQNDDVNEFMFYFTGHGEFVNDELYYIFSNFDQSRRRQTSLSNSELDELVRSLEPNLFSKMIDACNSGITYVKSKDAIELYLKGAQSNFKKIHFLFSSQANQFSYQSEEISYFTEYVLRSVIEHPSNAVRYRDVIAYLADEFDNLGFQTPLFVSQADFTEVFVKLTEDEKSALRQYLVGEPEEDGGEKRSEASLASILIAEAERYCTEDQAINAVQNVVERVSNQIDLGELGEIFEVEVEEHYDAPPSSKAIGKWLEQTTEDVRYFAEPTYTEEAYQRPKSMGGIFGNLTAYNALLGNKDIPMETAYRTVVNSYRNTWETPFDYARVNLTPKVASVAPEVLFIAPIVSRTRMRIFWAFSHFEYTDWDSTRMVGALEWKTDSFDILDENRTKDAFGKTAKHFVSFVRKPLLSKWIGSSAEGEADVIAELPPPDEKG